MKVLGQIVLVFVILYVTSYIVLRSKWTRTWDKDGKAYMHFPVTQTWAYYFYRPLSAADATLSGMNFHIGPHPGEEDDVASTPAPAASPLPAPVQ